MGKNEDSTDIDLTTLLRDELNLDSMGYSVEEEKAKHAIWKDGFVARWAMELVKTVAVAFVGFLAGGVSASKGA